MRTYTAVLVLLSVANEINTYAHPIQIFKKWYRYPTWERPKPGQM
jgi:hypothetical protein